MPELKPLGDKVIVQPIEDDDKLESGLYVPETAKDKPQRGYVLAVGPGRRDVNGQVIPMDVEVGEEILFAKYAGSSFKFTPDAEEAYIILSSEDIAARIIYSQEEQDARSQVE